MVTYDDTSRLLQSRLLLVPPYVIRQDTLGVWSPRFPPTRCLHVRASQTDSVHRSPPAQHESDRQAVDAETLRPHPPRYRDHAGTRYSRTRLTPPSVLIDRHSVAPGVDERGSGSNRYGKPPLGPAR